MKGYIHRHLAMGKYLKPNADVSCYCNRNGWKDFTVGEGIIFSHRISNYDGENFPEHLHIHDYCELLFWERGDIQYLCGNRSVTPHEGCVILIPSEKSHTARLLSPSVYERFVLYFKPSAFDFCGQSANLIRRLFSENGAFFFHLGTQSRDAVRKRLYRIEALLESEEDDAQLLAHAEITLLLRTLQEEYSAEHIGESREETLPEHVRKLRDFLDQNYASIESVEQVAANFYYSREYASRIFVKYFNLAPWKYVEQLRIRDACRRIDDGERITAVCYAVGYHSMSAFSAAFRRVMGASPTQYRAKE